MILFHPHPINTFNISSETSCKLSHKQICYSQMLLQNSFSLIFCNFHKKAPVLESLFNKVAGLMAKKYFVTQKVIQKWRKHTSIKGLGTGKLNFHVQNTYQQWNWQKLHCYRYYPYSPTSNFLKQYPGSETANKTKMKNPL